MHGLTNFLIGFLTLGLATSADAKYRIKFHRYNMETTGCGLESDRVGGTDHLHNNKCKTFDSDEAAFGRFLYEWQDFPYNRCYGYPCPKYDDDHCKVTVYSEGRCQGEEYEVDGTEGCDRCLQVPFGGGARSVSVLCNGKSPDNLD